MLHDTHPQLSLATFEAYQWHVIEAPNLAVQPKIIRLSDGTHNAFNLTTDCGAVPAGIPECECLPGWREAQEAVAIARSVDRAPFWIALPVQAVMCAAYGVFLSVCAIVRGLRWALCSE